MSSLGRIVEAWTDLISTFAIVFPTPPHSTHRLYTRGSM
ncbi:unnamed protein product [Penicillium camemberti]|uniref:Str. FM013 n=1 Tax=Penicillium camemberti (strain FM 013) TaxID=1429867 RepID=A0A0G4PQ64_PENC3|nr:unnamed protein product [Penicillium camemberti]